MYLHLVSFVTRLSEQIRQLIHIHSHGLLRLPCSGYLGIINGLSIVWMNICFYIFLFIFISIFLQTFSKEISRQSE